MFGFFILACFYLCLLTISIVTNASPHHRNHLWDWGCQYLQQFNTRIIHTRNFFPRSIANISDSLTPLYFHSSQYAHLQASLQCLWRPVRSSVLEWRHNEINPSRTCEWNILRTSYQPITLSLLPTHLPPNYPGPGQERFRETWSWLLKSCLWYRDMFVFTCRCTCCLLLNQILLTVLTVLQPLSVHFLFPFGYSQQLPPAIFDCSERKS